MPRQKTVLLVTFVAAVLVAGCSSLFQQNIKPDAPSLFELGDGLILGSVTVPSKRYDYHETLRFHYRSVGDGGKTAGFITSAKSSGARYSQWGIPTCDKEGLAEQCGRLFAVSLPAGDYEIHGVQELQPPARIYEMPPLRFTVVAGQASYLGNMHVTLCQGLVRSTRGAVLGGHLVILDESQRDVALLEAQYPQLSGAEIEMRLLPDLGWLWRVPWEPHDWGTCGSGTISAGAVPGAAPGSRRSMDSMTSRGATP